MDDCVRVTAMWLDNDEDKNVLVKHPSCSMDWEEFEASVSTSMKQFCRAYHGASWRFYSLSNGGFYSAPDLDGSVRIQIPDNHFEGDVSYDAAGIIGSLFVLNRYSQVAISDEELNHLFMCYDWLRQFALSHQERSLIVQAID